MMKKPKVLIEWENAGPPRVCFNCDFNFEDKCTKFDGVPPVDFQETPNACGEWTCEIPF